MAGKFVLDRYRNPYESTSSRLLPVQAPFPNSGISNGT